MIVYFAILLFILELYENSLENYNFLININTLYNNFLKEKYCDETYYIYDKSKNIYLLSNK
jgi:hypothetical protein